MSGYLRRLVDTAAGRGGTVHPRIGSVFSPRRENVPAPLPGVEDTEAVMPAPSQRRPQPVPGDTEQAEPRRHVSLVSRYVSLFPAPPASDPDDIRQTRPGAAPFSSYAEPVAAHEERPIESSQLRAADVADVRIPAALHIAGDPLQPPENDAFASTVSAPRAATARAPGVRRDIETQPDDIQIHIGRIEVIAVPPAAPRPSKAPDRSLSLDTYLSRRDRRPR